jgi:D-alanine-D-alanine ligase-like ATP-grasp enzyme
MFHILSPQYDPAFDRIGGTLQEIAVCSEMLAAEWQADLLKHLAEAGVEATWHEVSLANFRSLDTVLARNDTVWNLIDGIEADGYPGATVIGYLEELQERLALKVIGPRRAFYAQNKLRQKTLLMEQRIDVPAWLVPANADEAADCYRFLLRDRRLPIIIKPFDLYCSVGIESDSVVTSEADALRVDARLRAKTPNVLIEQFIAGREFTVVCIANDKGGVVYPPAERVFHATADGMGFMHFALTQVPHGDHSALEMAPVTDTDLARRIEEVSRAAYRAVGAESYVRLDIRLDARSGILYVLEVNPCPSVGVESSIEEILKLGNIPFGRFLQDLLEYGTSRAPAVRGAPDEEDDSFDAEGRVALRRDPVKGRWIQARRSIREGEPVFTAEVEAAGVEEVWKRHYCHHCLAFSQSAYTSGCDRCGQVFYCSVACRQADSAHAPECDPLKRLYQDFDGPVESLTYYRTDIQALARIFCQGETALAGLVTHFDRADTTKRLEAWRIALRLEALFEGRISLSNILATVCSTDCNCFSADYDPDGITLLSSRFSMLEHNCLPNAARRVEGRTVTVYALKEIPVGTPVAISYISALYHRSIRRQNLAEYYYFECGCPLCCSVSDEIPPDDLERIRRGLPADTPQRLDHSACFSFLSGRLVEHRVVEDGPYPSTLQATAYGTGLFATEDLPADCGVERFSGRIMPYRLVPDDEKIFALLLQKDEWLVADTAARFINHSCSPNCRIAPTLELRTTRPVRRGEELTISYNRVGRDEHRRNPECFFWDPRWTFRCECGSPGCPGLIDRYVLAD